MGEKVVAVKKHFSDNKKLYLGIGIGVAVTTATVVIFRGVSPVITTNIQKGYTLTGDVNQTINQIIEVGMSRPGPKSFVIQCTETQKIWPSIRAAADDLGVSRSVLGSHLKGTFPDVDGLHFEKLAEV